MFNYELSDGKTLTDLFNIINPNCYQAFIISCIISDNLSDALFFCNELRVAIKYYGWNKGNESCGYVDALICGSKLPKWKKVAILRIIVNDVDSCEEEIRSVVEEIRDSISDLRYHSVFC